MYFSLSSFFLSFFPPFYSEPCGGQALGAQARHQGCATEVGEPTSGHWSTRDLPAPHNTKRRKSPRDLYLNTKTQLHLATSKLQCWTHYAKQLEIIPLICISAVWGQYPVFSHPEFPLGSPALCCDAAIADDCDILYLLIWQAIFYFSVSLSIHYA